MDICVTRLSTDFICEKAMSTDEPLQNWARKSTGGREPVLTDDAVGMCEKVYKVGASQKAETVISSGDNLP